MSDTPAPRTPLPTPREVALKLARNLLMHGVAVCAEDVTAILRGLVAWSNEQPGGETVTMPRTVWDRVAIEMSDGDGPSRALLAELRALGMLASDEPTEGSK